MTKEEARELFEDNFTVINTHGHYTKEEEGQAQELAISALSENKEWIPVSERLPENNDDVLVYDGSDIFVAWYSGIDGNWCSADNRFDEYTPIVAWQPLPEPYKGE